MALVNSASLVETRRLLRRIACAVAPLWARSSFRWNELRRTSLFFKGLFMIPQIKDYAIAAINGTLEGFPADLNRWDSHRVKGERFFGIDSLLRGWAMPK